MAGFTKLFNSILDSTIWQEPNETRILWITMLAMSDASGEIQASIPGLAKRAGISLPECQLALGHLSGPDPFSRTPDFEGRRITAIDGGWRLLNHGKYRKLLSAEERKEYNRKKQAEWRENQRQKPVNDTSLTVVTNKQNKHISEAEAEAEAEALALSLKQQAQPDPPPEPPPAKNPESASVPAFGDRVKSLDALKARINTLRPEWSRPARWNYTEEHYLTGGAAAQMEEMEESDWDMIKAYMNAHLDKAAGYWQPNNRSKFTETFADVFSAAQRWASKTGNTPKPKTKNEGAWK